MDASQLQIPAIRGLRVVSQHVRAGCVILTLEADDEAAETEIKALLQLVRDPVQGITMRLSLKPLQALKAVSLAIASNRCALCGGSEFRREFKTGGSPRRVVDMLYCLNEDCGESMRISDGKFCEGLAPSESAQAIARDIGREFKRAWGGLADVDERDNER